MGNEIKLWLVKPIKYCIYTEKDGCVVLATTWQRAKGIALDRHPSWKTHGKDNITVEEIDTTEECIVW